MESDPNYAESISRRRLLRHILAGLGATVLPAGHLTSCAAVPDGGGSHQDAAGAAPATPFASAARAFSSSLSAEQRASALFPFADERRQDWHYVHKPRKGVPYK